MHTESVHDKYMLQKFSICHFDFSQKGNLKVHIGLVHEIKKHISAQYVIIFVLKNVVCKRTLNQFMMNVCYRSVQFVI